MCGCKIYCIYFPKVVLECQSIVTFVITLSSHFILEVTNFLSISYPANTMFAVISLGEYQWFYAITKHGFVLDKINYIKPDSVVLFVVINLEIKPLVVAFCVRIILEYEIISLNL